jgi:protein O-mannosyl-transferase
VPSRKEAKNRPPEPSGSAARPRRIFGKGPRGRGLRLGLGLGLGPGTIGLLAALTAAALYTPTVPYGWVWDDTFLVSTHGAGGVGAEGFRPVASLLYRLEWVLGYGTPLFAHLASLILHAVATWLVFRLALHVGGRPLIAFLISLLFAAHPIHTEAVAYVSGRPDVLATVFALSALLLARSAELCSPEGCRSWKIWPAYFALAAAVLSDEVAIVTPLLLIGLDRWGRVPVPWRRRLTHYSGFFAIVLVYLLVRFTVGGGSEPVQGSAHAVSGVDPAARAWAVPIAFFELAKSLLVPYPLNAVRTLTAEEAASILNRLAPFALLLALAAFTFWRRRDPLARVGGLILLLAIVPALPIPWLLGSYGEERGLYFASVGFCLLVGSIYVWLASIVPNLRPVMVVAGVVVAGLAGAGTELRLPVWRDNVSLLESTAKADPRDPKPHIMLSDYFSADRSWAAALQEVDRALAIDPRNHEALARRVVFLSQLGRYQEAAETARRAIRLNPHDAMSYANLSDALVHLGKATEGVAAARRAVETDSTLVNAWYDYGVALAADGKVEDAIRAYRKAIALDPNQILALNNLGALLGSAGRLEEARDLYLKVVEIAPGSVEARMNLALAYFRLGDRDNAAKQRDQVKRLDPSALQELDRLMGTTPGRARPR